jgi:hypothetical protein
MKPLRLLLIAALIANVAVSALADPRGRESGRDNRGYEQRDDRGREAFRNHRPDEGNGYTRRPIRDVIGEVEHNYRGRVVDIQPPRSSADEDMYRVRVLQEGGRVKTLHVPAERRRER